MSSRSKEFMLRNSENDVQRGLTREQALKALQIVFRDRSEVEIKRINGSEYFTQLIDSTMQRGVTEQFGKWVKECGGDSNSVSKLITKDDRTPTSRKTARHIGNQKSKNSIERH